MESKIQLSIHVVRIPAQEEFYMGVDANYTAYIIDVPEENIPSELLKIIKDQNPATPNRITNIAIVKQN